MEKIAISLFMVALTFVATLLVMINGWGLEVQSWSWLIGGYVSTLLIAVLGGAAISS